MAVGVKLVCQEQLSNLRPGEWESILVCKEILVGWWLRNPATTGGPEVTSRMRLQPPWANKPTGMDGKDSKLHANHLMRYARMHWDIELMTYWLEKTETTKTHVEKPQQCHHQSHREFHCKRCGSVVVHGCVSCSTILLQEFGSSLDRKRCSFRWC